MVKRERKHNTPSQRQQSSTDSCLTRVCFHSILAVPDFHFSFLAENQSMTETEASIAGTSGAGGDTEIDLYADVVENELETVRRRSPFSPVNLIISSLFAGNR
jgi:hypothetical protein